MKRARVFAAVCLLPILGACRDHEVVLDQQRSTPSAQPAAPVPQHFESIGRVATAEEVHAWNIDVNSSGDGLPAGHGTYAAGATVFARQCALCHGTRGEGLGTFPKLIGGPKNAFDFASDPTIPKTIGNYWPYATTVYDYVRRAMPLSAPGSLKTDEVYSVVAFLLAENGIISKTTVVDAHTLPRIQMPARAHFVTDDRKGGPVFR
jgi:S-disulfanyl-L-cysteine oxidoreductase SoxD